MRRTFFLPFLLTFFTFTASAQTSSPSPTFPAFEKWRAADLAWIVKSDRGVRIFAGQSKRRFKVPAEFTILHT